MSGTESARVEQADRDNAAEYLLFNHRVTPDDAERIKDGEWDETEHVKFFARIRLTTPPAQDAMREALNLNSAFLPAARAAADAAMAQTADEFDINDSADAQRWMDARNGAWFALSTLQPESVDDVRAALAEAIEALEDARAEISDRDYAISWLAKGVDFERTMPNETRPTIRAAIAAQGVAKHGDGGDGKDFVLARPTQMGPHLLVDLQYK